MVAVNDRPFLFYLLNQLSLHGINRFVLLTGYLGEMVQDYFGDGSQWGWQITYSQRPTEWQTATRIFEVVNELDEKFILLYSDNFAQLRLSELCKTNVDHGSAITLSIAEKRPGNIAIDSDGRVLSYDAGRNSKESNFVEIGYSLIDREKIFSCIERHKSESFAEVIRDLAATQAVSAILVKTGYESISDPVRLEQTSNYLKPKKILLLDRDGTLNKKSLPGEYINSLGEFIWIESSRNALKILAENGFSFIVITNQAGVSLGETAVSDLEAIHDQLRIDFESDGLTLLDIYVCTDHWNSNSKFRKPEPGMFFAAANQHKFRLDQVIYVGDDIRDGVAAGNAGCKSVLISGGPLSELLDKSVLKVGKSLSDLVPTILETYGKWTELAL
jgi:D-glycero-D-manno-heptose 1,7-bisphosphate phosphatase